jgi:N-formylglutamate deformylase
MTPVTVIAGDGPLVLGQPHVGTMIPPEVSVELNDLGRSVPDTDWWIGELYSGIAERTGATVVRQEISRYVIDVNRDPSGVSLYPGQNTTTLCPTTTFDAEPIYREGCEPGPAEIARRRKLYFEPFHAAMAAAIEAKRIRHGYCVVYDCHSIRSVVPNLFPGTLPVFNIGTNDDRSCHPEATAAARREAEASGMSFVVNGRFKGGWITRHYGAPERRVHAVQMELAQSAYMREAPPWTYDGTVAARTEVVLDRIVSAILQAVARLEA